MLTVAPADDVAPLIAEIRETYRLRQDLVRAETAQTNQIKAIARRMAGGLPRPDAQTIRASGHAPSGVPHGRDDLDVLVAAGEDSEGHVSTATHDSSALAELAAMPLIESRAVLQKHRRPLEKRLEKLAMQLPVYPWVASVRGFGALGLAQIIGETGDLSNYANPAKVWKRMGLAVMPDGTRQRRVSGAEALDHAYNPRRRSLMFVIGDSLMKGNRDGEYRTLYLSRKEYEREQHPDLPPMAHHMRAQRYMEKRLLRDLWRAWRASPSLLSMGIVPETLATDSEAEAA